MINVYHLNMSTTCERSVRSVLNLESRRVNVPLARGTNLDP